jgi:hypothetical protein
MDTGAESVRLAKEVINDVFKLTGQKTDLSDPVVAAALIFSRMVRQAGADSAKEIKAEARQLRAAAQASIDAVEPTKRGPMMFSMTWATPWMMVMALLALVSVSAVVSSVVVIEMQGQARGTQSTQSALDLNVVRALMKRLMSLQPEARAELFGYLGEDTQRALVAVGYQP